MLAVAIGQNSQHLELYNDKIISWVYTIYIYNCVGIKTYLVI